MHPTVFGFGRSLHWETEERSVGTEFRTGEKLKRYWDNNNQWRNREGICKVLEVGEYSGKPQTLGKNLSSIRVSTKFLPSSLIGRSNMLPSHHSSVSFENPHLIPAPFQLQSIYLSNAASFYHIRFHSQVERLPTSMQSVYIPCFNSSQRLFLWQNPC